MDVVLWINFSSHSASLISELRKAGWNPVIKSYGHSVPIAEVDGISFYGITRITANLLTA